MARSSQRSSKSSSRNSHMSWRDSLDVARAGVSERVRVLAAGALPPREQARDGSLLVLCAWTVFVVGGFGVQKASEHWQAVTPADKQGLPAGAFDVLLLTAGIGSALVLLGVALSLPGVVTLIRRGGWTTVRRPIIRATLLSLLAVAATIGLARWAHSLPQPRATDTTPSTAVCSWPGSSCSVPVLPGGPSPPGQPHANSRGRRRSSAWRSGSASPSPSRWSS